MTSADATAVVGNDAVAKSAMVPPVIVADVVPSPMAISAVCGALLREASV